MGAHAPITTLRPEANPPAGYAVFIFMIPSRDPSRLLRPLVRLVAAGDERVQTAQASESAVDFRLRSVVLAREATTVRPHDEADMVRAPLVAMPSRLAHVPVADVRVRNAERADLDALIALEQRVFAADRLSRGSLRRFLTSPTAEVIVAEHGDRLAGTAIVLFRSRSLIARLYSLAVAPHMGGRGVAPMLLAAAEATAAARGCRAMRLEAHVSNHAAISRYRKSGYGECGRMRRYYEDGGDALRFQKRLVPTLPALAAAPPYFHQSTEFTCGPACIMMALGWADRSFKPAADVEFQLWREATTIFMTSGPGGCEPYGMAVALKRHGLEPEVYISHPGPYFLDTAQSAEKRRVMKVTQLAFQRDAKALGIPTHLTPVSESVLMRAFDAGSVVIVLVSGYHMVPRGRPHWIFAFGRHGDHVLMHDPAAMRDHQGMAAASETYAIPWTAFERVTHLGRERLSAAIVIRKGNS
jgi:ribosomal protein S18 acetylase RimI-like enzyme